LDKNKIKLGGTNHMIQIDESLFAKIKYKRGKDLLRKQVSVFGKFDARTDIIYFQTVEHMTAKSLLSVIYDHFIPKSIIASDSYSLYSKINRLPDENIEQRMVNHSLKFLDPVTKIHTNKIESLWNNEKIKFKDMRGCNRFYNQSYLDEFMWQHNNKIKREETFEKILEAFAFVHKTLDAENIDSLQEVINGPDVELGFDIVSVGYDEDNEIDYEIEEDLFAFFDINNDSVSNQSVSNQTVSL
jgi:hypothetical protein